MVFHGGISLKRTLSLKKKKQIAAALAAAVFVCGGCTGNLKEVKTWNMQMMQNSQKQEKHYRKQLNPRKQQKQDWDLQSTFMYAVT